MCIQSSILSEDFSQGNEIVVGDNTLLSRGTSAVFVVYKVVGKQ